MAEIEKGLDHLATLGKPIHITEFTPPCSTKDTWTTRERVRIEDGLARLRCYHGTYSLRVPGYREATVGLTSSASSKRQRVVLHAHRQ